MTYHGGMECRHFSKSLHRFSLLLVVLVLAGFFATRTAARGAEIPFDLERWHVVRSAHFEILSNAEIERSAEIATRLEAFRAVLSHLGPSLELRSPAPLSIIAFRDGESFGPFKTRPDQRGSQILGQFLQHSDGNYLTLDAGSRQAGAFAVVYHEYVHFLTRHNFVGVPLWFHEGLAEYYSTFRLEGGAAVVGEAVPRHVRWLRSHGDFDLQEVLNADQRSETYHEPGKVGAFYGVSWLLVHYLLSGDLERLEKVADLFLRLEAGEEPTEAFEEVFEVRVSTLEEELREYAARLQGGSEELPSARIPLSRLADPEVAGSRSSPPAETLFRLGDLLAHMGRADAAESFFHVALEHDASLPDLAAGLAFVRSQQGRAEEATLLFREAVQLGSARAMTYLQLGRHLLAYEQAGADRVNEGLAALRRSVELFPDYGEAWALLGRAHLQVSGDEERGIDALRRARKLLPNRVELIAFEAFLEARRGERDTGERLISHLLAPRWDPLKVTEARDEMERQYLLGSARRALAAGETERGLELFDEAISWTRDTSVRRQMEAELLDLQSRAGL